MGLTTGWGMRIVPLVVVYSYIRTPRLPGVDADPGGVDADPDWRDRSARSEVDFARWSLRVAARKAYGTRYTHLTPTRVTGAAPRRRVVRNPYPPCTARFDTLAYPRVLCTPAPRSAVCQRISGRKKSTAIRATAEVGFGSVIRQTARRVGGPYGAAVKANSCVAVDESRAA